MYSVFLTNHAPNGAADEADVVVVLPSHVTTIEVQGVGAQNITTVDGTRPIVADTPHVVDTTIAAATNSRKK